MKDEKILNIIVIIYLVIMIFILGFMIYNLYHLSRFRKCYDSGFTLNYCEYYKDYWEVKK